MALRDPRSGQTCIARLASANGRYPSVGRLHAPAIRLERALRDERGLEPIGLPDARPWLHHADDASYAFLPTEGPGLHQVPVGPVHAGIIEPGHFRFTINGETVVRLEERLGYVHKGIEHRLEGLGIDQAARVAARASGDSTVAYSLAFANAIERILHQSVPPRARILRGIMAEIERIANHLGDFGAICNDTSAIALHAHCSLMRERCLQAAHTCFGHRLMMDRIIPGGVACDPGSEALDALREVVRACEHGLAEALRVYDGEPSILDRTVGTGLVPAALVARFAAGGHVGRASGRDFDVRRDLPYAPYDALPPVVVLRDDGDVHARALVRAQEIQASCALLRRLLDELPDGDPIAARTEPRSGSAVAMVEAFRGDLFVAVRIDADGRIARCHLRDASWFQWPLLEAAIEGNILADFPLCNKSFNCSYAGHDR